MNFLTVKDEFRVGRSILQKAPIVEEILPETLFVRALHETGGNDLIRIDVIYWEGHSLRSYPGKLRHRIHLSYINVRGSMI